MYRNSHRMPIAFSINLWNNQMFFDINMQRSDHICTRIGEMLGLEMARSYVAGDRGFGTGERFFF